ncbi:MAG: hypothetical protein KL863_07095 [Rhizobium sp.]|nr:hypothetical protein [Rhizobium sp.]
MARSLSLLLTIAGVLVAGQAFAQATTSDPLGINVIDEPTISTQRAGIGNGTSSTIPRNQRNSWDSGFLNDLNLDGEIDQ